MCRFCDRIDYMKVLAIVHLYQPVHNAGAEAMLHQILLGMQELGHEAVVACKTPVVDEYEGVKLIDIEDLALVKEHVNDCDVVFTHLDFTQMAIRFARSRFKPIVHLIHNDAQITYHKINHKTAQLFVANSKWIADTIKLPGVPVVTVYPPTDPKKYAVKNTGDNVTLINLNKPKGGDVFWQLVRIMQDTKFLGVKGGYGEQELLDVDLPNVTILDNTPDIKSIYSQSRIVLMPSAYESWGRVAIEAAASGIPVIASPTPGLRESLGDAGIFVDREDIAGFVEEIKKLDDPTYYAQQSKKMKARSKEIHKEFAPQLNEMIEQIEIILKKYRRA